MLRPVGRLSTLRYTRSVAVSQIKMPQLGESVTEGTVDKWLKHEGDFVKRDEPLVEVVTDKVNAEIPSPFEGKLVKIAVREGETVRVGAVIAQIETGAADTATPSAPANEKETAVADSEVPPDATAGRAPAPTATSVSPPAETSDGERTRLSPALRKLAAEHGIDPSTLPGSGMGGPASRGVILAPPGSPQTTSAAVTSGPPAYTAPA